MNFELIVWISFVLFMVHEFEEIIAIRPWLTKYRTDPRAKKQVFWQFRYASTSVIAALILEEYIIGAAITLAAVVFQEPAVFIGFLIPFSLHLIGHLKEAAQLKMYTPSLATSVIILPWCCYALIALIRLQSEIVPITIWTVAFTALIIANFAFIYRMRPILERYLIDRPFPT